MPSMQPPGSMQLADPNLPECGRFPHSGRSTSRDPLRAVAGERRTAGYAASKKQNLRGCECNPVPQTRIERLRLCSGKEGCDCKAMVESWGKSWTRALTTVSKRTLFTSPPQVSDICPPWYMHTGVGMGCQCAFRMVWLRLEGWQFFGVQCPRL